MTASPVVVEGADRLAWGAPPTLPVGSFYVADNGQPLRQEPEGVLEILPHGGLPWHRSIAAAPSAATLNLTRPHRGNSSRLSAGSLPGKVGVPRGASGVGPEAGVSRGTP